MCPACFRFVSIKDMCGTAQMKSAICYHTGMHGIGIHVGDCCVVDKRLLVDEVRPKVVIHGKDFFVPRHYPKEASGRLQCGKRLIEKLDMKTTNMLCDMCKHNSFSAQPTCKEKRAFLTCKHVFCNFI